MEFNRSKFLFWLFLICGIGKITCSSSEEETENTCIRLPHIPKRSAVTGETNINIVHLLNGGSENMKTWMSSGNGIPEDVILVLGNTGSGKTTLTQILTGNLSTIHAVSTHNGRLVIVDDEERIGAPSTDSRTLTPELATLTLADNQTLYFYDLPGFDDNRGPAQDLAANFFINQIIRKAKRVKLIFLVIHSSVQLGNDRLDFDLLAKHAAEFVRNFPGFKDSIGLVVTKVDGFSSITRKPLSDKKILGDISEFLAVYLDSLHNKRVIAKDQEKDILSQKIEFIDILLAKDTSGKFSNIAFSRHPEKCGPLSHSVVVNRTREFVLSMINSLDYRPVGNPANFGYTLKESTRLHIHDFAQAISTDVTAKVESLFQNITVWFQRKQEQIRANTKETVEFMKLSHLAVDGFSAQNLLESPSEMGIRLNISMSKIGFVVPAEFLKFMERQTEFLNFFDEAMGKTVRRERESWYLPVNRFQTSVRDWFTLEVSTQVTIVTGNVANEMNRSMEMFWREFPGKEKFANVSAAVNFLNASKPVVQSLENCVKVDPLETVHELAFSLSKIGYSFPKRFETHMNDQATYLRYFANISRGNTKFSLDSWRAPLVTVQNEYQVWVNNQVQNLAKIINLEIQDTFEKEMGNFMMRFNATNKINGSSLSATEIFLLPKINAAEKEIHIFLTENYGSVRTFFDGLMSHLIRLGYREHSLVSHQIAEYNRCQLLLDNIGGSKVNRSLEEWKVPVLQTMKLLKSMKENTSKIIFSHTNALNQEISEQINKTVSEFLSWYDREKADVQETPTRIKATVQNHIPEIQSLLLNLPSSPVEFGQALKSTLDKVGNKVSSTLNTCLSESSNGFTFWDSVNGAKIERATSLWSGPITSLLRTLQVYKDWYEFCDQVKLHLSSYDFQKLDIHKRISVPSKETDWLQYLEKHQVFSVTSNQKATLQNLMAQNRLASKHITYLGDIIKRSLTAPTISCAFNRKTVTITGVFVRTGKFLSKGGTFIENCSGAENVHIYAADTVFIDTDFYAVGKEMKIVLLAPKWHILGKVHWNLDGASGASIYPSKATNESGTPGLAGKPGGPGGSFVGGALSIANASNLKISVNGGKGGRGQDGADGAKGKDGTSREYSDWTFWLMVRTAEQGYIGEPGKPGGAGGNGGMGGLGGKAGKVQIISKDRSLVNIQARDGLSGESGVGGAGGEGGRGSTTMKCEKVYAWSVVPMNNDCRKTTHPDGARGNAGGSGLSQTGLERPRQAKTSMEMSVVKSEFSYLLASKLTREGNSFLAAL